MDNQPYPRIMDDMRGHEKTCKVCGTIGDLSLFYASSGMVCKKCHRQRMYRTKKMYKDDMGMKECSLCGLIKSSDSFYNKKRQCKDCYKNKRKNMTDTCNHINKLNTTISTSTNRFPVDDKMFKMVFHHIKDTQLLHKYLPYYRILKPYAIMINVNTDVIDPKDAVVILIYLNNIGKLLTTYHGDTKYDYDSIMQKVNPIVEVYEKYRYLCYLEHPFTLCEIGCCHHNDDINYQQQPALSNDNDTNVNQGLVQLVEDDLPLGEEMMSVLFSSHYNEYNKVVLDEYQYFISCYVTLYNRALTSDIKGIVLRYLFYLTHAILFVSGIKTNKDDLSDRYIQDILRVYNSYKNDICLPYPMFIDF